MYVMSQRLPPHIHGLCPEIRDREICVEFGAVEYMWCVCVSVLQRGESGDGRFSASYPHIFFCSLACSMLSRVCQVLHVQFVAIRLVSFATHCIS